MQLTQGQRDQIQQQAKKILDSFSKSLAHLPDQSISQEAPLKVSGVRKESFPSTPDPEFRERMFANASHKNKDNILAEKKSW